MNATETPRTRRPRNPDRHLPDGKYNAKPLDPEYFKKYYHEAKQPKECEMCGKIIASGSHMKRHRDSNKCMLVQLKKRFEQEKQAYSTASRGPNLTASRGVSSDLIAPPPTPTPTPELN